MTDPPIPDDQAAAIILELGERYIAWARPLQQGDVGALADAVEALSQDDLRCHLLAATLLLTPPESAP